MIITIGIGIVVGAILLFVLKEVLGAIGVGLIWIFEDEEQRFRLLLGAIVLVIFILYKIFTMK